MRRVLSGHLTPAPQLPPPSVRMLPRMGTTTEDATSHSWSSTRAWVEKTLSAGERVERVERLRGGWTSEMRRLDVTGPDGPRSLVLRSFVKPFFVQHAEGLLTREADVLTLLATTDVPAATLVAVDATARHCDHPSLLMTRLRAPSACTTKERTPGPTSWPASSSASTACPCPRTGAPAPTRRGPPRTG